VQSEMKSDGRDVSRRLRALRERHWPGRRVTQRQLAEALGGRRPLSESVISSWESGRLVPPVDRLSAYARFFATPRSVETDPARLLSDDELTDAERSALTELRDELLALRNPKQQSSASATEALLTEGQPLPLGSADTIGGGTWYFGEAHHRIVIVSSRLPRHLSEKMPYTDPADPDYVEAYKYGDLDALIELHGHIRAINPRSNVRISTPDSLESDDYSSHLVLLGGVDWNAATQELIDHLDLPVHQRERPTPSDTGYFEVGGKRFQPVIEERESGRRRLREDVAYLFRGVNPNNARRTITLCNGMFSRGTLGAVRALTDQALRNSNEQYLAERFSDPRTFGVLTRVVITQAGGTLTPDWQLPHSRLYEWSDQGEPSA
jgi:transcriptional regulator with XRE-family HTH domain